MARGCYVCRFKKAEQFDTRGTEEIGPESKSNRDSGLARLSSFSLSNDTDKNGEEIVGFSTDTGRRGTGYRSFVRRRKMKSQGSYAPPSYIPLGQSDSGSAVVLRNEDPPKQQNNVDGPIQWSSGICACCDDTQSCCIGLFCPCYLFGKNAEFLGSGTLMGSCTTHFILWVLVNTVCCLLTDGLIFGIPGCFVACYACGYRRALRSKYNLQEAPCGDFITHFFCHMCAICQEYREIREKSTESGPGDLNLAIVTAPAVQTMEPGLDK